MSEIERGDGAHKRQTLLDLFSSLLTKTDCGREKFIRAQSICRRQIFVSMYV